MKHSLQIEEGVMTSFYLNAYKKYSLEPVYLNSSQQRLWSTTGGITVKALHPHLAIQSTDKVATAGIPHLCNFP